MVERELMVILPGNWENQKPSALWEELTLPTLCRSSSLVTVFSVLTAVYTDFRRRVAWKQRPGSCV
jgi:hypothetical protein